MNNDVERYIEDDPGHRTVIRVNPNGSVLIGHQFLSEGEWLDDNDSGAFLDPEELAVLDEMRRTPGTDIPNAPTDADYDRAQWQHWKKRFEEVSVQSDGMARQWSEDSKAHAETMLLLDTERQRADAAEKRIAELEAALEKIAAWECCENGYWHVARRALEPGYVEPASPATVKGIKFCEHEMIESRCAACASPATVTKSYECQGCGNPSPGPFAPCAECASDNLDNREEKK